MSNEYKILFIGGMFLKEHEEYIQSNSISAIQNAANLLQWNYIRGIEKNVNITVDILNALFVGTFPKYFKKILIKGVGMYVDNESRNIIDVGFVNLPLITEDAKYLSMKDPLRKWVLTNKTDKVYIIAYGFFEQNIRLLSYAKNVRNDIVTCLIIPDLPQFMSLKNKKSVFRNLYYKRVSDIFNKLNKNIDVFSVITRQMYDALGVHNRPFVVIDGMIDEAFLSDKMPGNSLKFQEPSGFSFLYSGGLSESYGTDVLVNSFLNMKNRETQLWICGDGPYRTSLLDICNKEKRIKYFGTLPHNECIELQKRASCLINPREDSEITKYSFPSKTMEYLASGKPVIAKRLEGMSVEYSSLFFEFSSQHNLSETMDQVSSMDKEKLKRMGIASMRYVAEYKNNVYQTKQLLDMMSRAGGDKE